MLLRHGMSSGVCNSEDRCCGGAGWRGRCTGFGLEVAVGFEAHEHGEAAEFVFDDPLVRLRPLHALVPQVVQASGNVCPYPYTFGMSAVGELSRRTKKTCVSHCFNEDPEGLVVLTDEAGKIPERAAACEDTD